MQQNISDIPEVSKNTEVKKRRKPYKTKKKTEAARIKKNMAERLRRERKGLIKGPAGPPPLNDEIELLKIENEILQREFTEQSRLVWREDPVRYAQDRFGITFWGKQADVVRAIQKNRRVAVYSANGIGKTFLCAVLACWWLELQDEDAIVFITGSNWHVIENVLLPEIMKLIKRHGLFDKTERGILQTKITLKNGNRLIARATDHPEGLQGLHTRNMLTICEETSGMEKKLTDAIEGNSTGGHNHVAYMGNPLSPSGEFYSICMSRHYPIFSISAFEVPNVITGEETLPGAATRQSILGWFEREKINPCEPHTIGAVHLPWLGDNGWYIPNHVIFSRVLGKFPDSDEEALISRAFMELAAGRQHKKEGLPSLGCDPSRFGGDKTILAFAYTNGIDRLQEVYLDRATDTNGQIKIAGTIMEYKDSVSSITVDVGMGTTVIDTLRSQKVEVREFNFGGTAELTEPDRFADMATEAAWKFKEAIETNPEFFIPDDAELIQEAAERKYMILADGRKKLEKKADFKKRIHRSPDKFDAAIMAFYGRTRVVTRPYAAKVKQLTQREGLRYFEVERSIKSKYD